MPFPMRIQPIDSIGSRVGKPPVLKSRLKRLFDRPFNGVLRISSSEKPVAGGDKDGGGAAAVAKFEPSSVCLDKMVQNFIEDTEKPSSAAVKCARNRGNCFNGNDSSDDELDFFSDSLSANSSFGDASDTLKSLLPCVTVVERNLLADTSKIVEKNNKSHKTKDDLRKIVADGLISLGYNASICRSKWDKSSSIPAGEYEYIDVVISGERVIIDVDFRSEFEIARSTSSYQVILQNLPHIFVGKTDRLIQIVGIASEAARLSLKKKGMHIAPWRKADYVKSKWAGPHTRLRQPESTNPTRNDAVEEPDEAQPETEPDEEGLLECEGVELGFIFDEDMSFLEIPAKKASPEMTWHPPAVKVKSLGRGNKVVVTGLASLLQEKF